MNQEQLLENLSITHQKNNENIQTHEEDELRLGSLASTTDRAVLVDEMSMSLLEGLCYNVAFTALSFKRVGATKRKKIMHAFRKDLCKDIIESVQKEGVKNSSISLLMLNEWIDWFTNILKMSFDRVCERFASRFDVELFRGRRGLFLKKVPLYKLKPEKFWEKGMPMHWYDENYSIDWLREEVKLEIASFDVSDDETNKNICSQCKKKCDHLKSCSRCGVAKYCSKNCQVSLLSDSISIYTRILISGCR